MFGLQISRARVVGVIAVVILVVGVAVGLSGSTNRNAPSSDLNLALPEPYNQGLPSSVGNQTFVPGVTTVEQTETATVSSTSNSQPSTYGIITNPSPSSSSQSSAPSTNQTNSAVEFFGNLTLQVGSPQVALSKASVIAYSLGGYVAYSFMNNATAIVVLRVPAGNYQTALSEIQSLGNVTGFVSTSNDVMVQYTDLNATLQALLTEQASLLRLANQSASLNETLLLQSQLQRVNAQINDIESQILQTRLLISYSTITATFITQAPKAPLRLKVSATPQAGISPLAVTLNAVVSGGNPPYIVNYNFGDGTSWQGQALIHTFTQSGTYNVTVTVTDSSGNVQEAWLLIHVASPPSSNVSEFQSFTGYLGSLFISVVEGIAEVAVVVIPLAMVVAVIWLPVRRFRASSSKKVGKE